MVLVPTEELWCLANVVDVSSSPICQYPEVYALTVGKLARCNPTSVINERERAVKMQRNWSIHYWKRGLGVSRIGVSFIARRGKCLTTDLKGCRRPFHHRDVKRPTARTAA
jgi:hypothetical protein